MNFINFIIFRLSINNMIKQTINQVLINTNGQSLVNITD